MDPEWHWHIQLATLKVLGMVEQIINVWGSYYFPLTPHVWLMFFFVFVGICFCWLMFGLSELKFGERPKFKLFGNWCSESSEMLGSLGKSNFVRLERTKPWTYYNPNTCAKPSIVRMHAPATKYTSHSIWSLEVHRCLLMGVLLLRAFWKAFKLIKQYFLYDHSCLSSGIGLETNHQIALTSCNNEHIGKDPHTLFG